MPTLLAHLAAVIVSAAPLTLEDALAEAARASHDVRLARADVDRARADVSASYAGVLPRLDLGSVFGRRFIGSQRSVEVVPVVDPATGQLTGFDQRAVRTPARDFADYQLALTVRQPLFDGRASWHSISAAKAGERAAARIADESTLQVAFQVTRLFYEVVKAEESRRVLEETVARSRDVLARAEALFIAGRAPKSDVISAQVNLANDRIQVEAQGARVAQARAELSQAIGREADPELTVVPPATLTGAPADAEPPPLPELVAQARARRPLLAAQREALQAALRSVAAARGAFWPVLSAQGSYTRSGPELSGGEGVLGDPTRQYVAAAQLVLQWNLFAGGETGANEQRAAVAARRAAIELERSETVVSAELAVARASAVALQRSAQLAAEALSAAVEGQRGARERFSAGVASLLEVRDAELKLTQARLALLNARVDHAVASADLARAGGGR